MTLNQPTSPNLVELIPCTVTQVSPLQIKFGASDPAIPGVKLAGCDYALGAALALVKSSGSPVVLPIGV